MVKKGDTLIEVTLAVGIFSMIAIAITAVMSSGTSGAQSALETTLTREEIDAQAEALRFIQSTYIANRDSASDDNPSKILWESISKDIAFNLAEMNDDDRNSILNYAPTSCATPTDRNSYGMYGSDKVAKKAFIINPRGIGAYLNGDSNTPIYYYDHNNRYQNKIISTPIYPRLVYSDSAAASSSGQQDGLLASTSGTFYRAEGIYIIAVKGQDNTRLVGQNEYKSESAYYDFYIRTCWYGTDATVPSTISTVIRLYDPDSITPVKSRD